MVRFVRIVRVPQTAPRSPLGRFTLRLISAMLVQNPRLAALRDEVREWWLEVDDSDLYSPVKREMGFSSEGTPIIGYPISRAIFPDYGGAFDGPEGIGGHPYPEVSKQDFEAAWEVLVRATTIAGSAAQSTE